MQPCLTLKRTPRLPFSSLVINLIFFCNGLILSLEVNAQSNKSVRIAYISTQSEAVVKVRANLISEEFRRRWLLRWGNVPELDFDIRNFELSPSSMNPSPQADAKNRAMFAEVIARNPEIIYAAGADAAMLAKTMTSTIPIVLGCKCNPGPTSVRKLVMNLCAPEANLTGFTRYDVRVIAPTTISLCSPIIESTGTALDNLVLLRLKVLSLAREPKLTRIGAFYGEDYDEKKWQYKKKAAEIGITLIPIRISSQTLGNLEEFFTALKLDGAVVLSDSFTDANSDRLIAASKAIPKPTIFSWDEADSGAWMHFGTKVDLAARAVDYIIPILRGQAVRDLPVSFPTEYELVVNYKLAKDHGWVFPRNFLLQPQRESSR